jgi:hypothetical protein
MVAGCVTDDMTHSSVYYQQVSRFHPWPCEGPAAVTHVHFEGGEVFVTS